MTSVVSEIMAEITLYPTETGGRKTPLIGERYGCPCKFHEKDFTGWDCRVFLRGGTISPGETKRFPIAFTTPEAGALFQQVEKFYLWEGHIIGEATLRI